MFLILFRCLVYQHLFINQFCSAFEPNSCILLSISLLDSLFFYLLPSRFLLFLVHFFSSLTFFQLIFGFYLVLDSLSSSFLFHFFPFTDSSLSLFFSLLLSSSLFSLLLLSSHIFFLFLRLSLSLSSVILVFPSCRWPRPRPRPGAPGAASGAAGAGAAGSAASAASAAVPLPELGFKRRRRKTKEVWMEEDGQRGEERKRGEKGEKRRGENVQR